MARSDTRTANAASRRGSVALSQRLFLTAYCLLPTAYYDHGRLPSRFSGHIPVGRRGPQRRHRGDPQLVCEPQSPGHPLAVRSGRAGRLPDVHPQVPGALDHARRGRDVERADRDHDRRRDVLDEPRRASVRRLGDGQHGVRADQRRPDELDDRSTSFAARPARRRLRASPTARPST